MELLDVLEELRRALREETCGMCEVPADLLREALEEIERLRRSNGDD